MILVRVLQILAVWNYLAAAGPNPPLEISPTDRFRTARKVAGKISLRSVHVAYFYIYRNRKMQLGKFHRKIVQKLNSGYL